MAIAVATAIAARSFDEAAKLLAIAAELTISPRHLQSLGQEVGGDWADRRRQETAAYRARPAMAAPAAAQPPIALAAVMIDGGRLQTRQPDSGPGVHEPAWRETKTAVLLRMKPHPSATDPHPDLPACFAVPPGGADEPPRPAAPAGEAEAPAWKPTPLVRSGLATLQDSEAFGWTAAAAAEGRGFFTAAAKAFVSDGLAYNWSIQRRHLADFEPILDFVHAAGHVHDAAKAAGGDTELGRHWAELCWRGRVDEVLAEIDEHRDRIGPPPAPDEEPDHPWCALGRQRGYLEHNRERMDYPRYRREGLPITSSPVESWIKQLNQRVKGSEKFWNGDGNAESMLELRAAWLDDAEAFVERIIQRPGQPQARPRGAQRPSLAA
jgi:hypothetical protein